MNRIISNILSFLLPLAFAFAVYTVFIEANSDGWKNVLFALIWGVFLPVSLIVQVESVQQHDAMRMTYPKPVPNPYHILVAMVVFGMIAWSGYIITALVYIYSRFLIAMANSSTNVLFRDRLLKERNEQ